MIVDISRTPPGHFMIGDTPMQGHLVAFHCDEETARILIRRLAEIENLKVFKAGIRSSMGDFTNWIWFR